MPTFPERTPVPMGQIKLTKREWVQSERLVVMGVDPGLGSVGVAVLEQVGYAAPRVLFLTVTTTEKATKKDRVGLRVSTDDKRRYREIWDDLDAVAEQHKPNALAVEVYEPYGKQGGTAWKCAVVYGMLYGFAFSQDLVIMPFRATDLKQKITNKKSASKEDVEHALESQIMGLKDSLAVFPKTKHEHAADAAGHALMGLRELHELRQAMGVRL